VAVGPQQGRKVFSLQTLPVNEGLTDNEAGKVAGFSLHAGVAAWADQRDKLERLCRYLCRPAAPVAHSKWQRPLRRERIHKCRGRRDAQERSS